MQDTDGHGFEEAGRTLELSSPSQAKEGDSRKDGLHA